MAGVIKLNIISTAALPLFECPITCERFVDPVLADDGYTYEREAIVQWLRINNTSPITRQPMSVDTLRPNFIVKQLLELESRVERQQNKFKLNIDVRKKFNQPFMRTYDKQIYEAQWLNNQGPPVVILQINGARALKQASFYSKLTLHPNIVRTFGLVIDPNDALNNHCVMLLQEYATLGDLSNLLQNQPHPPNENVLIEMFIQITEAMCFLAEQNIVHGDLACRNILVFNYDENIPNNNLVKLTDFGLSRGSTIYTESATTSASTTMKIIPIRAAAPEVLEQQHSRSTSCYTEKADMFSMGVLMWEAYSKGSIPWVEESDDRRICSKVMNGERLSRPTNCSDRVWKIILKCMAQSPTNRPTFKDLKQLLLQLSLDRTSTRPAPYVLPQPPPTTRNNREAIVVQIPCQFCNNLFHITDINIHQQSCTFNPQTNQRRHQLPTSDRYEEESNNNRNTTCYTSPTTVNDPTAGLEIFNKFKNFAKREDDRETSIQTSQERVEQTAFPTTMSDGLDLFRRFKNFK